MTREDIKRLALECGFTERLQPDGTIDLNPYVYEFAARVVKESLTTETTTNQETNAMLTTKEIAELLAVPHGYLVPEEDEAKKPA